MKKNDVISLEITALTGDGRGVGRSNGMVVFVPLTAVGDVCEVKILKVTKNYSFAKLEKIITASPDRIEQDCPIFGKCGGCALRHINYQAELAAKENSIKDAFMRIGGMQPEFLTIIANYSLDNYRNKAQYPLGRDSEGKAICGFYAPFSHRIVPVPETGCKLQPPIFTEIVNFIVNYVREHKISIYNEQEHKGVFRHICLRRGYHSGEVNVTLVVKRKTPEFAILARVLSRKFPEIKGVVLNVNPEDTNVILGETEFVLTGKADITDTMCGCEINISPRSFYQINTEMAERLYAVAKEFAEPEGKVIFDLYCGTGTIGLSMANTAKNIIGVEVEESAVINANENAKRGGYSNIEFICGDVGEISSELIKREVLPDVIVIDPARRGCDNTAIENIIKLAPERVIMISCNPATAARDCSFLAQNGYKVCKIQGVDMFSRTSHVECVCLMTRKDK